MGTESNEGERWATYAAAWLPLLVYVCTAAGHGYWLDSPEFTAVAVGLDIAHPPGHPLFALWSQPFLWLPVGSLPFRVAIGQAVATALALAAMQRAVARCLRFVGVDDARLSACWSLGATWLLAAAYGVWFQAVRAEVYALQAMLVCSALERLSVLACSREPRDPRPFYAACLALGLGLANHHFIAILAMPVLAVGLWPLLRRQRARVIAGGLLAGALGLSCYVYLPLRAAALPSIDLGHPLTWRDFYWVISAQVYAKHIGTAALQPLGERFADLAIIVNTNATWLAWPLGYFASYALARVRRTWPLAALWLGSALISLCGRAWLNPVRDNPDVLGYMIPGFAALFALEALCLGVLWARWSARRVVVALSCAALALAVVQHVADDTSASLRTFHASDRFDDLRRRALPTHALVVLTTPDVVFRHWEGEAVEQLRSDVVMLPLPFIGYGGLEPVWTARHPEIAPLIASYQRTGQLDAQLLRELARDRPVLVELDTTTTLPLWPYSTPDGLLYRVRPEAPSADLSMQSGRRRDDAEQALGRALGGDLRDKETSRHWLWVRYVEALYFAWHGAFPLALHAADGGLALAPGSTQLVQLRHALGNTPTRPFDLTPYLVP